MNESENNKNDRETTSPENGKEQKDSNGVEPASPFSLGDITIKDFQEKEEKEESELPSVPELDEESTEELDDRDLQEDTETEQADSTGETGTPDQDNLPEEPQKTSDTPSASATLPGSSGQNDRYILAEIQPVKHYRSVVVSTSDKLLGFSGENVLSMNDIHQIEGNIAYIVDFEDSPDMGIIDIQGQVKYAQVLARKKLEESGDLSNEGLFWSYSQRKFGKNQASIFYQIFPQNQFNNVFDDLSGYPDGGIIHDSVSFLFGLMNKLGESQDRALALHLPNSIVLLAGRGDRVKLVRRYTLLSRDEQSLRHGIWTMTQEVITNSKSLGVNPEKIDWIEVLSPSAKIPVPLTSVPVEPWPLASLNMQGKRMFSSLPHIVDRVPDSFSLGPREELWIRPLEKAEKWFILSLAALVIFFTLGWLVIQSGHKDIQDSIDNYEQQIVTMNEEISSLSEMPLQQDMEGSLAMAQTLQTALQAPSLGYIWNELADLKPFFCSLEEVSLNYSDQDITVQLKGEIQLDIAQAQSVFTAFLTNLDEAGYTVQNQALSLDIGGNFFTLQLKRPFTTGVQ